MTECEPVGAVLAEALAFAVERHRTQPRKGTKIPYVSHLMAVSSLVLEAGGDGELAAAGLLHDVIEDTETTADELRARFSKRVVDVVVSCTDADVRPKPPWRDRKQRYIDHLRDSATSDDALLVSVADKLHNARSMLADYAEVGEELWLRFNVDAQSSTAQLWYYDQLTSAFEDRLPVRLTAQLRETVRELHRLTAAQRQSSSG